MKEGFRGMPCFAHPEDGQSDRDMSSQFTEESHHHRGALSGGEQDVPIRSPDHELLAVQKMAGTLEQYRSLDIQTMLLGGTKSRLYLTNALDELNRVM
jgi:hypothetical protein